MDSVERGELDSPLALLLQQVQLEADVEEAGLELEYFHSPEYAKFRMEGGMQPENVEVISPCEEFSLDSPSDSDSIFDISEWVNEDDVELEAIIEAAEAELQKATQRLQSRARAKQLEDEETKALMQEWSLNDKAFDAAPATQVLLPSSVAPPPLANGLGPVLHMRNGGSLRSMSPSHFQAGDGDSKLVMQVSNPVVVPSEMGATSMAILRRMAMAGMEGMGAQAVRAMSLEDITGKGVDQLSVEHRDAQSRSNGFVALEYGESNTALTLRENNTLCSKDGSRSKRNGVAANSNEDYMGLEDLAPMAMAKIEALALEGLRIQAEMADQEAPCVVEPHMTTSKSNLMNVGHRVGKEDNNFMSMAVSLDEWMRLDAGVCSENKTREQTLAIIAAHNNTAHNIAQSNQRDVIGKQKKDHTHWKRNANTGYMGDTITLAMLVQLRDPLRGNEPVGASMMALVQAERVMVPPKPKLGCRITSLPANPAREENDDERPRFKIVGVTVAGLKTSQSSPAARKTEVWGSNQKQLQAGSRWLVAQGMQKATKAHPALKGKAQVKVQRGDSLWSISARVHGSGAKWRDLARLNPHIRNPDIIFPDTSIRTH